MLLRVAGAEHPVRRPAGFYIEGVTVIPIGLDDQGKRSKPIEAMIAALGSLSPASEFTFAPAARTELVSNVIPDMLRRDLAPRGLLSESVTIDWRLLDWVEFA